MLSLYAWKQRRHCSLHPSGFNLHADILCGHPQAADAIVSVATVLVMLFLLPKILQWLREQEEHNRCEQHLVAFFTCVLLPRTGNSVWVLALLHHATHFGLAGWSAGNIPVHSTQQRMPEAWSQYKSKQQYKATEHLHRLSTNRYGRTLYKQCNEADMPGIWSFALQEPRLS